MNASHKDSAGPQAALDSTRVALLLVVETQQESHVNRKYVILHAAARYDVDRQIW